MQLFTDSDLDGISCGIVAKIAFGDEANVFYCTYRNLNQRVAGFLDDPKNEDTPIYITDLAVNEIVEKELAKRFDEGKFVQVIDHHVTAMHFNDYKWGWVKPEDASGTKTCAASLLYHYLIKKNLIHPTEALDTFIELVRQYDTWDWEANDNTEAKRLNDLFGIIGRDQFESEMLQRLMSDPDHFSLSDTEQTLLDIEEKKIERYINSKRWQIIQAFIDDYCVGIVHAEQYHSELGNTLNKIYPHLDMIAIVNVGTKKMSLRTIYDHVDVSEFAKHYNGGGHPKASGCELNEEAFKKFVIDAYSLPSIKPDPEQNEFNVKGSSYSTCFINRKGDISFIRPLYENEWEIIHAGLRIDRVFPSFDEAERYLKRQYASWLRYDDDIIHQLTRALPYTEEEVRTSFDGIMQGIWTDKNQLLGD
ncbi:DHH family phosphoesterase [Scopulibacillus cellulosilyticus]|uniref:DHH family phosphoesterase n=1 Tax=Scopulibacillus cellulosilyticus TaxID=2665665 RepID=A0ABW2Q2B9_9BACL